MRYLLTTTALGLILAVTPAAAQDKPNTDAPAMQSQTPPAPPPPSGSTDMQKPSNSTDMQKPSTSAQTDKPAATTDMKKQDKTAAAAPSGGSMEFVQTQSQDQPLASDMIGQSIVNANNESIGDINDLLLDKDGKVQAVVVGVGGFLGIGEKKVAVPYDQLQFSQDENRNMKVSLNVTKESLDSAPEFQTVDDQKAAQDKASRPSPAGPGTPRTQ